METPEMVLVGFDSYYYLASIEIDYLEYSLLHT
jgi:hypothetical protein